MLSQIGAFDVINLILFGIALGLSILALTNFLRIRWELWNLQ